MQLTRLFCLAFSVLWVGCRAFPDRGHGHGDGETRVNPTSLDGAVDKAPSRAHWLCRDDHTRCSCKWVDPEVCFGACPALFGEDVPFCRTYELCRVLDDFKCVCSVPDPAEPAPEGQRVSACPALTDERSVDRTLCAAEGDPCALADLSRANLGDCCEGLVCDLHGTEGLRCREATEADNGNELACRRASVRPYLSALRATTAVVTSQGTIPIMQVGLNGAELSSEGRLRQVTLHLFRDGMACDVSITAMAADGADPLELPITAVNVRGFPCGLATTADFSLAMQSALAGTLSLEPQLYCDTVSEGLCLQGVFTISIAGRIPARSGSAELSFLAPISVEGTLCGSTP